MASSDGSWNMTYGGTFNFFDSDLRKSLSILNKASIGTGTFNVNITDVNNNNTVIIPDIPLYVDSEKTVGDNITAMNAVLDSYTYTDSSGVEHKASEYFALDVNDSGHL